MSYSSNRLRRYLVLWPMCLATIFFISTIGGSCKPIDNTDFTEGSYDITIQSSSSQSSAQPQRKTLDQEIGSPSELAWSAWLLADKGDGQAALDSSNILRRITAKSIFIAPDLENCGSSYSTNRKGCKSDPIKIDEEAQKQFLLNRLKNIFGKKGNNQNKSTNTVPLQINIPLPPPKKTNPPEKIPLAPQSQSQPSVQKPEQETVPDDKVAIPVVISQQVPVQLENDKNQEPVAVIVYKVTNDTKKEEKIDTEKSTYLPGGSTLLSTKKETTQSDHVVSVAGIVDNVNETYPDIVDYNIPGSVKAVINRSDALESTRYPIEIKVDNSDSAGDSSPTVVLLLSPTKLSTTVVSPSDYDLPKDDRLTTKQEPDRRENTKITEYKEETKFKADSTIQTVSPLDSDTTVDQVGMTTQTSTEKTYTNDRFEEDTAYIDEETQTESVSEDNEEYKDTTEEADQDDFSEGEDELLKPGEAGMMIPTKNQDLFKKIHKHQLPTTMDLEETTSTALEQMTTVPTSTNDNESTFTASDSTIKSEPTDYTKEDIISTVMTENPTIITTESNVESITTFTTKFFKIEDLLMSSTQTRPTQITTTIGIDNRESTDKKDPVTEPAVITSTQGSRSMTTSYGRKKLAQPAKVIETPHAMDDLEETVSKMEIPLFPEFPRQPEYKRPKPPVAVGNNEPIYIKNDGNIPSEFKGQIVESSRPAVTDFRRVPTVNVNDESYVRFPEQQQGTGFRSQQNGYVRFPSDEVNSIHNQNTYKEHLLSPYRTREEYSNSPTSTKSSVPVRQKQGSNQWRVPPLGMRMNRQQQQIQSSLSNQRLQHQKQNPMLLRFWQRMPLVRDLSFNPPMSRDSHNEPIGGSADTHRVNSRFSQPTTSSARQVNYYGDVNTRRQQAISSTIGTTSNWWLKGIVTL